MNNQTEYEIDIADDAVITITIFFPMSERMLLRVIQANNENLRKLFQPIPVRKI